MFQPLVLLSGIVFVPALAALVLMVPGLFPKEQPDRIRYFTLGATLLVVLLAAVGFFAGTESRFDAAASSMQSVFSIPWIPSFRINYFMGIDGISFPLILLTAVISALAMGASWPIKQHVKAYCVLFLLLETGMLGVFLALDFFLFYVFWEVMLLPMYFLIGVWGGPRREYAAIKFFLYTLVGSVLMLIAILLLYFNSDLRALARISDFAGPSKSAAVSWQGLHIAPEEQDAVLHVAPVDTAPAGRPNASIRLTRSGAHAWRLRSVKFESQPESGSGAGSSASTTAIYDEPTETVAVLLEPDKSTAADVVAAINGNPLLGGKLSAELSPGSDGTGTVLPSDSVDFTEADGQVHTFNLLALMAIGQHTDCFSRTLQIWCFVLLFIGFAIKVPSVPLHTWLPDAHVEAPTPISMILAGVLLKMGGYGIIRICYPICPFGGFDLAFWVCLVGVVSMIYGAFAAMAQRDFKRLVAYSSVSHMGYVVLGLGVWSAQGWTGYQSQYWSMGVQGAMFQMIAHGISSAGMFFLVGVIYDRVHHRNLNEFGALFGKMPVYTALSIGIFFAALGLPGLCGFIGEVLVVFSALKYSTVLAVLAASVVIITAAYILWTVQRVYLGPQYRGPHEEDITPMTPREFSIAAPLFVLAIVLGVLPYQTMLRYITPTTDRQVSELAAWTQRQTTAGEAAPSPAYAKADDVAPDRPGVSGMAVEANIDSIAVNEPATKSPGQIAAVPGNTTAPGLSFTEWLGLSAAVPRQESPPLALDPAPAPLSLLGADPKTVRRRGQAHFVPQIPENGTVPIGYAK